MAAGRPQQLHDTQQKKPAGEQDRRQNQRFFAEHVNH
jgi:hypothetical protein